MVSSLSPEWIADLLRNRPIDVCIQCIAVISVAVTQNTLSAGVGFRRGGPCPPPIGNTNFFQAKFAACCWRRGRTGMCWRAKKNLGSATVRNDHVRNFNPNGHPVNKSVCVRHTSRTVGRWRYASVPPPFRRNNYMQSHHACSTVILEYFSCYANNVMHFYFDSVTCR